MTRHGLRSPFQGQRFARTMDEAFRTPRYSAAIEKPYPGWWSRFFQHVREVLA